MFVGGDPEKLARIFMKLKHNDNLSITQLNHTCYSKENVKITHNTSLIAITTSLNTIQPPYT